MFPHVGGGLPGSTFEDGYIVQPPVAVSAGEIVFDRLNTFTFTWTSCNVPINTAFLHIVNILWGVGSNATLWMDFWNIQATAWSM